MKSSSHRFAPQRLRRNRGVSLVETLVALGLLAIMFGSIAKLVSSAFFRAGRSYNQTQGYVLAEQALESMRTLDYEDMVAQSPPPTPKIDNTVYTVTTTVVPDDPSPNMKRVTATVTWTSNAGPQNATVSTIFTQVHR